MSNTNSTARGIKFFGQRFSKYLNLAKNINDHDAIENLFDMLSVQRNSMGKTPHKQAVCAVSVYLGIGSSGLNDCTDV
jgi:hypothetical protein